MWTIVRILCFSAQGASHSVEMKGVIEMEKLVVTGFPFVMILLAMIVVLLAQIRDAINRQ